MSKPNYKIKPGLVYRLLYSSYTIFSTPKPLMKNGNFAELEFDDTIIIIEQIRRKRLVKILSKHGIHWMLDTIFYDYAYDSPPLELM